MEKNCAYCVFRVCADILGERIYLCRAGLPAGNLELNSGFQWPRIYPHHWCGQGQWRHTDGKLYGWTDDPPEVSEDAPTLGGSDGGE